MFFNQSKVTQKQLPEKVKKRKRHQLLRGASFFFLLIWLGYLTLAVNGNKTVQMRSEMSEFDNVVEKPEKIADVEQEYSSPLIAQLDELLNGLAEDQQKKERITEKQQIADTIFAQLKAPEGIELTTNAALIDGQALLHVSVSDDGEEYVVSSTMGIETFADTPAFSAYLKGFNEQKFKQLITLYDKRKNMLATIVGILDKENVASLLSEKGLGYEADNKLVYLKNAQGSQLLTIAPQPMTSVYSVSGQENQDILPQNLELELGKLVTNLDSRSELQKIVDAQREEFAGLIESSELKSSLLEAELKFSEITEKPDGLYVELQTKDGNKILTIMLEHGTGLVNVIDDSGAHSLDDYFAQQKKNSTDAELDTSTLLGSAVASDSEETVVYLMAGKHGSLTDTLMLAFVDEAQRKVRLLSIPRDLFWQGRKINSYFAYYGMDGVVNQLERIFAVDIKNYMLVDMYAFIDVVNILGGVDVTLENAVIDPTYKTFDDGQWGTLHYEPGTYHLNGVQALRLARSRHTSSDFARAERQQLILQSLQNKAQALSFWEVGKLATLAKAVLDQLETDVSVAQAIELYQKYGDYEVVNLGVLSSGNVLYSTYSNIDGYNSCIAVGEADCSKGAYILLPRNDNWGYLPRYVRSLIEG